MQALTKSMVSHATKINVRLSQVWLAYLLKLIPYIWDYTIKNGVTQWPDWQGHAVLYLKNGSTQKMFVFFSLDEKKGIRKGFI